MQPQPQNEPEEPQEVFPITDVDYQAWQDKIDDATDLKALKKVGTDIGNVASRYDQPSKDKLNEYYKDRMKTLKEIEEGLPA